MIPADGRTAFTDSGEEAALRRQAASLVAVYLKQMPTDEPRPLAVETTLSAPLVDPESGVDFGIPLLGIVDLILEAPAGPLLCDFKTAARGAAPLEVSHEVQLGSYAWLLRRQSGRKESALEIRQLIKTKVPRVEFHRYPARTEVHFRRLFGVIRAYFDALDTGRFTYRPGWSCAVCDFRHTHCRNWTG